jgi:hypothetical protein
MRINGKSWKQEDIEGIWEKALPLQGHEDLVIREKAENVIYAILESGRYGSKGKWEVKEEKGLQNYEKYLAMTGKQKDPKVVEGVMKIGSSRYN